MVVAVAVTRPLKKVNIALIPLSVYAPLDSCVRDKASSRLQASRLDMELHKGINLPTSLAFVRLGYG